MIGSKEWMVFFKESLQGSGSNKRDEESRITRE